MEFATKTSATSARLKMSQDGSESGNDISRMDDDRLAKIAKDDKSKRWTSTLKKTKHIE